MFGIQPQITKEFILLNTSQQEIFEHYLNIKVELNTMFCSPLRKDSNPTCSFKWINGTLYYRDWAESSPKDCFNVVMEIYHIDFYTALEHIFNSLIKGRDIIVTPKTKETSKAKSVKSEKKNIKVKIANDFQPEVRAYLRKYYLTKAQTSKFNIVPIQRVWIEDRLVYTYSSNKPALGYYFGKDEQGNHRWKIYFFTSKTYRFIGNTNRINGWIQLPQKGKVLIITKSLKDVACLDLFNVPAIAMQAETTIPYDYIIEELKDRFEHIYSLYDFDRTGIINANKLKKLYNIPYLFFTNGRFGTTNYQVKDFSDYLEKYGKDDTQKLINYIGKYEKILSENFKLVSP